MSTTAKSNYCPKIQLEEIYAAKEAVILKEISALNNPTKEARIHEIREKLSKFRKFNNSYHLFSNPRNDIDTCRRDFIDLINRLISSGNQCVISNKHHTLIRRKTARSNQLSYRQTPYTTSLGHKIRGQELIEFDTKYAIRFINLWNEYRELLGRD
tara:strand:- start:170 stop:637 length:468 start_codon:yes stop_codon:yes gene_type:complete